jgi:hypothetical protein
MRLQFLPILCLLSTATASAFPQKSNGPPHGKGLGGRDPPLEKYIARVTASITRLDSGLKLIPQGGSVQEAQRITEGLMQIQGTIISDLREGSREIRTFPGPPLLTAAGISTSLLTTGQKLTSAMKGWVAQRDMMGASGSKNNLVSQMQTLSGAIVVFYDDIAAKIGTLNHAAVITAKNAARSDVDRVIEAFRW